MGVKSSALKLLFCMVCLWTTVLWAQPEVTHKVQRKETAFGIARQYGVDVNALFELNRWAESGIRKGDVLRIPKAAEPESPAPSAKPAVHPDGGDAGQVVPGRSVLPGFCCILSREKAIRAKATAGFLPTGQRTP